MSDWQMGHPGDPHLQTFSPMKYVTFQTIMVMETEKFNVLKLCINKIK